MGLSSAASLEQVQISFNALLGSAEKGEQVFKDLQKFAAVTPFEFPEVAAAAKRFLAFNQTVGLSDDQLQEFLTTVGDVASVTGAGAEGLNRVAFAIGQIGSRGKVQLEEINQISEAIPGFSALQAIAAELGITTAEVSEMISKGQLDAVTGVNALLEGMKKFPGAAGAMEMQAQTLLGVFSTFKDTVGQAMAESFKPVIPVIKETLTQITPIIGDALTAISPEIGSVIGLLLPLVGELTGALAPLIASALKLIRTVLEPLIPVIISVTQQLGDALVPIFEALGPALVPVAEALGEVLLAIVPLIPSLLEISLALVPLLALFLKAAAAVIEFLAIAALEPVLHVIAMGMAGVGMALGELVGALDDVDWHKFASDVGDAFSDAWDATKRFFTGVGDFFHDMPGNVIKFIKALPAMFVAQINRMFDLAFIAIGVGIGLLIFEVQALPGQIMDGIRTLTILVPALIASVWDNARTTTESRWSKIIAFVRTIPGKVRDAAIELIHIVPEIFSKAWDRAQEVTANAVSNIIGFFTGLPGRLSGFAVQVATGITDFIKNFLNRAITKINEGIAKVDDVVPGDLPRLPLLAHGGVAFGPAIIGEDPSTGPEAAIPLGDARAMAMLREGLGTGTTFAAGSITVNVTVNGDVSASKAQQIGANIGSGLQSVLAQRNITTAVKVA